MSRGKKQAPGDASRRAPDDPQRQPEPQRQPQPEPTRRGALVDLAIMLGAFVVATLAAEAAGAANLGTALSFGQIAFALAAVYVLVRRA